MKHLPVRAPLLTAVLPLLVALHVGCSTDDGTVRSTTGSGGAAATASGGTSASAGGNGSGGAGGASAGKSGSAGGSGGVGAIGGTGGTGGALAGGSGGNANPAMGACETGTCDGRCIGSTCGGAWTCQLPALCAADSVPYCGCDGKTFNDSSLCAGKTYAYSGECETGATCDTSKVLCKALSPQCPAGQVASVSRTCWGPCVPIESCGCKVAADCPMADKYTCHLSKKRCGPFVL